MIFITIQGINKGGEHTSLLNNEFVSGEVKNEYISNLLTFINKNNINANVDNTFTFMDNKYFCTLPHPTKDVYNRTRLAMLWWDKYAKSNLKDSIEKMGLDYNLFKERFDSFLKTKDSKNFSVAKVGIFAGILAFIAWLILH